jgi:hypothetical protein
MSPRTDIRVGKRPSYWTVAAAALAALTAAVHLFAGTPQIHTPLLGAGFETPVTLELYAAWHLVSVALALSAGVLLWSAWRPGVTSIAAVSLVSAAWALFGAVFIAVDLALAGPSGLLDGPQWTILLTVGVLGLLGARESGKLRQLNPIENGIRNG